MQIKHDINPNLLYKSVLLGCLDGSVRRDVTLDVGIMGSGPTLGIEIT